LAALRAIEAGSELAHVVAEKADAPNLTGPARALSRRAHDDIEAGLATPDPAGDIVWVSPVDIIAKRQIPLPPPVAEALRETSASLTRAAYAAAAAAAIALGAAPQRLAESGRTLDQMRQTASEAHRPLQPIAPANSIRRPR
jgi:hypothetical protein